MVYISCSGGLGDVVQTYLSNPPKPEGGWGDDEFPSSDPTMSMWFRRLTSFRVCNPDEKIQLVVMSHNPRAVDFFKYHPCIDDIEKWQWKLEVQMGNILDAKYGKEACIHAAYHVYDYEPTTPQVYMTKNEEDALDKIIQNGDYILVHPFAGLELRMPLGVSGYVKIVKRLMKEKQNVVIVGASYTKNCPSGEVLTESFSYRKKRVLNLVNVASVRLAVALALNCSGFVGTLSAMVLPAWYAKTKTVCIVPTLHDTGITMEKFISNPNPSGWGLTQPFNKTFMIEDNDSVDEREVVDWLCD